MICYHDYNKNFLTAKYQGRAVTRGISLSIAFFPLTFDLFLKISLIYYQNNQFSLKKHSISQ